jgi:uncharacterized membrane protein YhaH (DUF805 family)
MTGPIAAIEAYFLGAFNFTGRATRAEYWWVFGFEVILYLVSFTLDAMAVLGNGDIAFFALATPWVYLLNIVPSVTLTARRLHDTGRSSFWYLVNFVPFIGPFWVIALLTMKSEDDDNKWGTPRRPMASAAPQVDKATGQVKSNPMQGYAVLINADREPSPEQLAARREQISDYYRAKVLRSGDAG